MARAGAVWLSVLPDMSLFNKSVAAETRLSLGKAGTTSGASFGRAFTSSTKASMAGLKTMMAAEAKAAAVEAEKTVRASAARVGQARKIEADAAGAVTVAEARLAEVRGKEKASSASIIAAEERVAKAHRSVEVAAQKTRVAEAELATAQKTAAGATKAAAVESEASSGKLAAFGAAGHTAFGRVGSAAKDMVKTTATIGAGLGAFAGAEFVAHGIKAAGDFQKQMLLLVTAGGEARKNLGMVSKGIQDIAISTGTSTDQLAEGMYVMEKAGLRGANGLKVLKAAAQGAKDENVDLSVMTNAVTSVMRSYNLPASKAVSVTNQMVAASGAAKTTMQQFAGSLSTVLPIASAAHLSFAQVGGAIATLTSHGTSADEATLELSNTIRNLQAPNRVAINEMAQFGISANDVSRNLGKKGLSGTLNDLTETVLRRMGPSGLVLLKAFNQSKVAAADAGTMFQRLQRLGPNVFSELGKGMVNIGTVADPVSMRFGKFIKEVQAGTISTTDYRHALLSLSPTTRSQIEQFVTVQNKAKGFNSELRAGGNASQTFNAALKAMLGGATGLNTALMLTGGSAHVMSANVKAVGEAGKKSGKDIATWGEMQKSFNVQLDKFKAFIEVAGIRLGTVLIPQLMKAGQFVAGTLYPALKTVYQDAFKPLFDFIGAHSAVFKILAAVMLAGVVAIEAYSFAVGVAAARQALFSEATLAQKAAIVGIRVATLAWAAAQWVLNAAMAGNPIVLTAAAVVAFGVALVVAYKKSATFRAIVQAALHGVLGVAKTVASAFVTAWHAVVGFFTRTIPNAVGTFVGFFTRTIPNAVRSVVGFFRTHWKVITEIVLAALGPIGLIAAALLKFWGPVSRAFTTAFHAISHAAQSTWHVVTAVTKVALTVLKYTGEVIYGILALPFYLAFVAIRKAARAVWGWIGPYVMAAVHGLRRGISTAVDAISRAWSATWNTVRRVAQSVWNGISGFFKAAWNTFAGFLRRVWRGWVRIALAVWNTLAGPVRAVWNALSGFFTRAWGLFAGFLRRTWQGWVRIAVAAWNALAGPIRAAWNAIAGFFTRAWGAYAGFVRRQWDRFVHAAHAAWDGLAGPLHRTWNAISSWFSRTWSGFSRWVGHIWSSITDKITGAFSSIPGGVGKAWDGIKNVMTRSINWIVNHILNPFIRLIDHIPGVNIPKLGTIGGGSGPRSIGSAQSNTHAAGAPRPTFAKGGVHRAGLAWAGERGAELMQALPGGGVRIYPHAQSVAMARAMGEPVPGYSVGGFFGGLAHAAQWAGGKVWSGAKAVGSGVRSIGTAAVKGILHGAEAAADAAISHIPGGAFAQHLAHGIVSKVVNGVEGWIGGKGKAGASGGAKFTGSGSVRGWITQALGMLGLPVTRFLGGISNIIAHESGGNPNAINLWDSNARAGHPSKGLMQTIPSTFAAYVLPALRNRSIYDPVANITAGVRYALANYGPSWLASGGNRTASGAYRGYDSGGPLHPGLTLAYNGTGKDEHVLTDAQMRGLARHYTPTPAGQPVEQHFTVTVPLTLKNREVGKAMAEFKVRNGRIEAGNG